jgi:hypothetical protein
MPTTVDAAALVAALSAAGGHVAACEAVRAACDMSALPAEEEVTAYAHHEAGVALVRAGALAALATLLTAEEAEEHQQAVKAALNAMRAVRTPHWHTHTHRRSAFLTDNDLPLACVCFT